jgi:protein-S-isoprenylcysteine O-methyltransferase Ste14
MGKPGPRVEKKPLSSYLSVFIVMPVFTYLVGSWVDEALSLPRFPPFPYNLIFGFLVFIVGLSIGIKSTRLLYRLGAGLPWGEARAEDQSSRLVTTGLYHYARNPMVLGYSMLPLGMGLMFQSISMAVMIPSSVLLFNVILVKTREEKRLAARFGDEYLTYKKRTPFLLPRLGEVFHALRGWRGGYLGLALTPLLGLAVLICLTYQHPSPKLNFQSEITTAIFLLICIVGAIAGLSPGKVSGLMMKKESTRNESGEGYRGHHPTCGAFATHVIDLGNSTYCSGCTGLIVGAMLAIIYTIFFIYFNVPIAADLAFTIGTALIVLGILQHLLDNDHPTIHTALNAMLVLGVALARSAAQTLNGGVVVDVYALALTLYIILSRIEFSQKDHETICQACGNPCERSYTSITVKS